MARWFGPKRVGWGVGPRSWQGWAATAVVLAAFIGAHLMPTRELGFSHWLHAVLAGAALAIYLFVVWLKYEPD